MQKVLIVDDDPNTHTLIRICLADEPVEIHSALNGASGIEMARKILPDVILLDLDMPDLDGYEVCRRIKADVRLEHASVIFVTAADATEAKVTAYGLDALDYVTKPFNPELFVARVRVGLNVKQMLDLIPMPQRHGAISARMKSP